MGIRNSILLRVRFAFLLIVVIATAIIVRISDLQFVERDKWEKAGNANRVKIRRVDATRGNILADDGSLLATSIPFYKLAFDPCVSSDSIFNSGVDSLSQLLSRYFKEKSASQYDSLLRTARKKKRRYLILSHKLVKHQDKKHIDNWPIFREGRHNGGLIFTKYEKRFKPFDDLARRTIGFISKDEEAQYTGRGLEFSFNNDLAGIDGEALFQRVSGNQWKPLDDGAQVRAENGLDIQTTINMDFEEHAHNVLKEALIKHEANFGTVLLMEVKTGQIKAIVNLGRTSEGNYVEDFNYAIQGVMEPGSTFKSASMLALLEEFDLNVKDSVNAGDGKYMFYDECIMTDSHYNGFGMLSVDEVIEKSSNIGISKLVFKNFRSNPERFFKYLDRFNLTSTIGFQMEGEGKPYISRPGDPNWSGCSLPWISIGYEVETSPLQMLTFYNAIANNGKMIAPRIVKKILRGNEVISEAGVKTIRKSISSERSLKALQGMLRKVVQTGTAKRINNNEFAISGKTGTTQKLKNGKYTKNYYTSFVGYFPSEAPTYSMIVAIDEPKGANQYGGDVCAPVFLDIAEVVYSRTTERDIHYVHNENESAFPYIKAGNYNDLLLLSDAFDIQQVSENTTQWVRTRVKGDTIAWVNASVKKGLMPDVRGMTLRDAMYLIENEGATVHPLGNGRVVTQSISPGSRVNSRTNVYLKLQ
ncbi:penicillin-binding protein [Flammeovirga kamogawensis]|uniref:Transpeptidase family protein n=1 Tax=Flammeovirga kamogawensis TaxID=373891 RepID=A0ABX8GUQ7_9BACT|nr:penicillin-binding protein [Flammeovirga kamogawensis]MBB6459601.1 cell division protein FtsI (penicillin-binding protein 3) [Flammeovirga kamogawensis]QWG07335.1 transpeptidase family protein [Flammeovirga kamogawensis]TRX69152.1 PASTA domain-containing protein [Flammeovirga kamogawensis]